MLLFVIAFIGYLGLGTTPLPELTMNTPANTKQIPVLFDGKVAIADFLKSKWFGKEGVSEVLLVHVKSQKSFLLKKYSDSFKIILLQESGTFSEGEVFTEINDSHIVELSKKYLGEELEEKSIVYCIVYGVAGQ